MEKQKLIEILQELQKRLHKDRGLDSDRRKQMRLLARQLSLKINELA